MGTPATESWRMVEGEWLLGLIVSEVVDVERQDVRSEKLAVLFRLFDCGLSAGGSSGDEDMTLSHVVANETVL
jgi:hypothetical protein